MLISDLYCNGNTTWRRTDKGADNEQDVTSGRVATVGRIAGGNAGRKEGRRMSVAAVTEATPE